MHIIERNDIKRYPIIIKLSLKSATLFLQIVDLVSSILQFHDDLKVSHND